MGQIMCISCSKQTSKQNTGIKRTKEEHIQRIRPCGKTRLRLQQRSLLLFIVQFSGPLGQPNALTVIGDGNSILVPYCNVVFGVRSIVREFAQVDRSNNQKKHASTVSETEYLCGSVCDDVSSMFVIRISHTRYYYI